MFNLFARKFDRRNVNTQCVRNVYGKGAVAWMRGDSTGRRHFGFA